MAKLVELSDEEVESLCDELDIAIEAWQDTLEEICLQPFDTWEQLLEHSSFSENQIRFLTEMRRRLKDEQ